MAKLSPFKALEEALVKQASCAAHKELARSRSPEEAALWHETFQNCSDSSRHEHLRWMGLNDLFFFGAYLLHRTHWIGRGPDHKNASPEHRAKIAQWYFDRCNEVQNDPNNHLDCWAREHAKSEIITFALTLQDILKDPNETFGIFSHNRPMAKQFLKLIKVECETNDELKDLYPDVLFRDPQRESQKWSMDDGITFRRTSNRKESTVEAWGLIDGQPTSKRFTKLLYDDVVARDQTSEQMIQRTTEELKNSFALTASDPMIVRIIGTPQEIGDTICDLLETQIFNVRLRPAVDAEGQPRFFSEEKTADLKNKMGQKVFALQYLLDPAKARDAHAIGFEAAWFQTYREPRNVKSLNRYILIDPAGKSKESNSLFALWVVGLAYDKCKYILGGALDELSLVQKGDLLFKLVKEWEPLKVVYEKYAYQTDIEYLRDRMDRENFRFTIVEVGGVTKSKDQRIERLMPDFRDHKIIFPEKCMYTDAMGKQIDIIKRFKEQEFDRWPFAPKTRDQLDALSRLCDDAEVNYVYPRSYSQGSSGGTPWGQDGAADNSGWMAG